MRNPILHAEMLAWRARCRSIRHWSARAWSIAAGVALLGVALVVAWCFFIRAHAPWIFATAMLEPFALLGLCAALACYIAMHGRRRRATRFAQSWLSTLPLASAHRVVAMALPVAVAVLLLWVGLAMTIVVAALAAMPSTTVFVSTQLCTFFGVVFGGVLGWGFGLKSQHRRGHALAWGRVGKALARSDGLSIVSRWPLLQARSDVAPGFHARAFLPVLLGMPVGLPVAVVAFILAMCGLILLLIEIARGLLSVVPVAVFWLRSTPLSASVLTRTLGNRAGLWFIVWLFVAGALAIAAGLPLLDAGGLLASVLLALFGACAWRWPRLRRA